MKIKGSLRLLLHYIAVSVRGQMQYKTSFAIGVLAQFLLMGVEWIAIWSLFARFGNLATWTLPEVALLYGMANMAFAISETAARGFDIFGYRVVKQGDFDWLLLRPRSTALQVAGLEFRLRYLGRFVQGAVVLSWATAKLGIAWTFAKAGLAAAAILGGACMFSGLFVLQAVLCFWTTESLEILNTVTYGGVETAQYPLAIYRDWFRKFFTYVIPLACLNYFPALAILGRTDPSGVPAVIQWMSPVFGVLFLLVTLRIWEFGVRHYRSTGS
jgi:ABC-2 type transport system permease protein